MRSAVALMLLAAPAFAQSAEDIAAMTKAIEDAGCLVTAENGDAVQAASGLDGDQTIAVIAALYDGGLVALTADGNMKLTNETCE